MVLRRIFLFLGLIFFWHSGKSQTWCGVSNLTEAEKKLQLELIEKVKSSKKLRKGTAYEIFIKPKIIHKTQASAVISTSQVFELINKLNQVFSEINIQFVVEGNSIEQIFDDEFYDLKTENDGALRAKYDSNDAINLYFTHTIIRPDLSQLNGYTSLPNLSRGSNSIILSYLDNTPLDFSLLKEKIIVHEFGHYFGLLHTYQDSNNEDISKRELVTRSIGANCNSTGDYLCDTPADPFDRIPSIFSLECTEKIPADIADFNGENYTPPIDNYMSYHHKCGLRFTPMQFQKMESGLSIRLSPFAEYTITRNISNFLAITDLDKKVYCKGENIVINYQKTGSFESSNQFKVELSDKNGASFQEITNYEILNDTQIKIKVDPIWENGSNYRVIIKSTLPYSESPVSENFEIKSLPSAEISSNQKTINRGDELQLNLKFGGSGPWNFKDWDGAVYEKINSPTINFNFIPDSNRLYFISEISNECGVISQSPSVFIEVLQPSLQIQSNGIFCNETLIDLPISGIKVVENSDYYQVQIKNNTQIINILPNTSPNSVKFYLPQEIQKDKTYSLRIVGKKIGEFSNTILFSVKNPPEQPSIITPVHVCFGTQDYILKANGQNLKWYTEPISKDFTYSILLNTQTASKNIYYVSQSDSNQCESLKSKMEVIVDDPVSAKISGDSNIFLGDSSSLNISLKGSPPWHISIEPLGEFNINTPEIKIAVNPTLYTEYKLSRVANYCGQGIVSGKASVTVLSILGSQIPEKEKIKVYPNPIFGQSVFYELANDSVSEIIIYSLEGKKIKAYKVNKSSKGEIFLPSMDSGKYNLKFIGSKKNYNFQIFR